MKKILISLGMGLTLSTAFAANSYYVAVTTPIDSATVQTPANLIPDKKIKYPIVNPRPNPAITPPNKNQRPRFNY